MHFTFVRDVNLVFQSQATKNVETQGGRVGLDGKIGGIVNKRF